MKEFLNRFSFGDFVAYFLPGFAAVAAVATIASFTPLSKLLPARMSEISVVQALGVACVAYVVGALISGASANLLPIVFLATRRQKFEEPRDGICPREFAEEIRAAFARAFPRLATGEWSGSHFYLMRTAVHQTLPQAAGECMRQNSLMQLRENLLLPVMVWGFVGVAFGATQYAANRTFAICIAVASSAATYIITGRLAQRACENRRREVREVCLAFLVADRLALLTSDTDARVAREGAAPMRPARPMSIREEVAGDA